MRRIMLLYVAPFLSVLIIAVKLPEIDGWIRKNYSNAPFLIAIVLGGATLLIHVINVISPFKKYEKLEKNKWLLIDNLTSTFLGSQLFPGYPIVANIMVPKRVLYCNLETCNRDNIFEKIKCLWKHFYVKMLHPIWLSENHMLDRRFRLTTNQGVSGMAYSYGKTYLVDIPANLNKLNLNEKQISAISGRGFVISHPVRAFDERYKRISDRIIGVVTLSCSTFEAEKLIAYPKNRNILTEKAAEFANICSLIL